MIAAPCSGSGKSTVTMALARAFTGVGKRVRVLKSGPDYIDSGHLSRASGASVFNVDSWAMDVSQLKAQLCVHAKQADLVLVEGAMGLFDGAIGQQGCSADVARVLELPVILVLKPGAMAQSVGALVMGFAYFDPTLHIAGCILNQVMSPRHEILLDEGLKQAKMLCLGQLPFSKDINIPSRHLGLMQAEELASFDDFLDRAADWVQQHVDLEKFWDLAQPVNHAFAPTLSHLPPLGQHMAIAQDEAFSFIYAHHLAHWHGQGTRLSFFSPLCNQAPDPKADAIFLPGGYPELHAAQLAANNHWQEGLKQTQATGALIYGECGGYMALGEVLIDAKGKAHQMAGLLPVITDFSRRKRQLGYRLLSHKSPLPWPDRLKAHEFHYSTEQKNAGAALFQARDLYHDAQHYIGCQKGQVMGSYAHIIEPDLGS